ncbi:MAG: dihydrolipoyllysine-residue acetyltransferase [Burkholderiaceae bacterium]|nr:MAG: dihydrolipoyllysine-residue acetyltransferase [Burkholderiaceae bacterium]
MAVTEVKVPDIGDFADVGVIEILVKPGDSIKPEQSLVTVESDKASMEIPSDQAGTVKELKVKLGDKVSKGSVLLTVEAAGEKAAPAKVNKAAPAPAPAKVVSPAPAAHATPAAPVAAGIVEIRVPDLGDFKDVGVIEVLVKPGDTVKAEQSLVTVESDKASMEIPSSASGTLKELRVKLGDKINAGDLIALLEGAAAPAAASPAPAAVAATTPAAPAPIAVAQQAQVSVPVPVVAVAPHDPTRSPVGLPHASPSVRKFARELGVPLEQVKGSGPKGRILLADVQGYTKAIMSGQTRAPQGGGGVGLDLLPWPKVDFAKFGPVDRKELSRIKKLSGANLARNWVMIPHVTNNDEADITELEAFRKATNKANEKSGVKVTMLAFVIKAVVVALQKYPEFNASLDGDALVYKRYFHVGFAADTPHGLVVPVLKDADKKGVLQISREMSELAKKARDGKLGIADMQGGCISISSLGGIGGTHFTPIINAPEVAILGLSKNQTKPFWDGKQFVPRLYLPLSLSYDHRVIDGAAAARFNAYLVDLLGDFRRVLL